MPPCPSSSQNEPPGMPITEPPVAGKGKQVGCWSHLLRKLPAQVSAWVPGPDFPGFVSRGHQSVLGFPGGVQPLAGSWISSMIRASGFHTHPTHAGPHRVPPTSYGLSDPQITKECLSRNRWVMAAVSTFLGHSRSQKHKPTQTFLLTLNPVSHPPKCPGPFGAPDFPSFISSLVRERPQYSMVFAQIVLVYHVDVRTSPPRCLPPGSVFPGIHKKGLVQILQKSILLPLGNNRP